MVAALAACGGGGGGGDVGLVRVVNATSTHASIDLLASSVAAIPATVKDSVSAYVGVASGSPILQLDDAGASTALATLAPTVSKDLHYTVLVYESSGTVKTSVLGDDNVVPAAGTAELRVFDAAPDAGAVAVYVTDPAADLAASTPAFTLPAAAAAQASTFLTFGVGTYRVRVTGVNDITVLRLDIPSVALASQQIASVVITPTVGGVLADGGVLIQQGAYTATRNTNARVRLAAAVAGAATVGATSGNVIVSAPTVSPSVGSYAVVPAANSLAVNVNGASVQVPATSLQAGSDTTLLVYGAAAAPTVSLIAADNHLTAATTAVKMRLLDGVTGGATPLTLDADFGVVAAGVQPGTMSPYGVVTGNATMRLDVTSPSSLTPVYTESNLSIPGGAVYTLFMLGDSAAPAHLLRRDR